MTTSHGRSLAALSETELRAARLDGDVFELGTGFLPSDAVETPAWRAGTLIRLYGDRLAAVGLSAAWVHGALRSEPVVHLAQPVAGRRPHVRVPGLRVRDRRLDRDDVSPVGALAVLSPACTLADLALALGASDRSSPRRRLSSRLGTAAQLREAFEALAGEAGLVPAARAWLERRVTSNKVDALRLLAQAEVTRYTS